MIANIRITKEVEAEVMLGLEKGKRDALYMRELMKEGKIKPARVNMELVEKLRKDFRFGIGEASVIAMSVSSKIPMLSDDNKARKIGKILGLDILSSLDFPTVLYEKGVITYDRAIICLEVFRKEGWFGENILIEAYNNLEKARGKKK